MCPNRDRLPTAPGRLLFSCLRSERARAIRSPPGGAWQHKGHVETPAPAPVPAPAASNDELFNAFRVLPRRRAWPWLLFAFAVAVILAVVVQSRRELRFEIVTPTGIAVLNGKMQAPQVQMLLGRPIAPDVHEGCMLYGHPKMDAKFWLYSVCYAEGRVKSATSKPYEAHQVEDGVIH
jgi:hypothetical protein